MLVDAESSTAATRRSILHHWEDWRLRRENGRTGQTTSSCLKLGSVDDKLLVPLKRPFILKCVQELAIFLVPLEKIAGQYIMTQRPNIFVILVALQNRLRVSGLREIDRLRIVEIHDRLVHEVVGNSGLPIDSVH